MSAIGPNFAVFTKDIPSKDDKTAVELAMHSVYSRLDKGAKSQISTLVRVYELKIQSHDLHERMKSAVSFMFGPSKAEVDAVDGELSLKLAHLNSYVGLGETVKTYASNMIARAGERKGEGYRRALGVGATAITHLVEGLKKSGDIKG